MYNMPEVINMTSALEAIMLVCFGLSWPLNLIKNIKAKTAKSMSLKFIILIVLGYIAGIMAKIISNNINYVLAIYILNLAIVSVNIIVYIRNTRMDKQKEKEKTKLSRTIAKEKTEIEQQFSKMNELAKEDAVVFFGTNYFANMPVDELSKHFGLDEDIYNRSVPNMSIDELCNMIESCVVELMPSKVFINIGENESDCDVNEFIEKFEWLMYTINTTTNADIYIVSILNENADTLNKALMDLCNQYGCKYIDITSTIGTADQNAKAFSILKPYIRKHPISFYNAMNA